jgi:uncharacterized glyoxalase superfamily protein PhnB
MHAKRSVPASSVVPVLAYPDVPAASDWLCYAFGFRVQFRDGEHRAHLAYGNGSVILVQGEPVPAHVQVRVEDASAHRERAEAQGALIDASDEQHRYTALDPSGYRWTFESAPRRGRGGARQDEDGTDWVSVFSAPERVSDTFEDV